jgi:hypothetical protein
LSQRGVTRVTVGCEMDNGGELYKPNHKQRTTY